MKNIKLVVTKNIFYDKIYFEKEDVKDFYKEFEYNQEIEIFDFYYFYKNLLLILNKYKHFYIIFLILFFFINICKNT